jgi:hypothetical protein
LKTERNKAASGFVREISDIVRVVEVVLAHISSEWNQREWRVRQLVAAVIERRVENVKNAESCQKKTRT